MNLRKSPNQKKEEGQDKINKWVGPRGTISKGLTYSTRVPKGKKERIPQKTIERKCLKNSPNLVRT